MTVHHACRWLPKYVPLVLAMPFYRRQHLQSTESLYVLYLQHEPTPAPPFPPLLPGQPGNPLLVCPPLQLHALPRLGRAGGQGYAYSAAGYWAGLLWGAAGTSMEKIEAGAGAGTKAGDAEPLWRQGVGGRVGCRGDVGRVVRRLLYERDASRPAAEVVWELFEGVAGVVGAEAVGQAAGAGDGEAGAGKWQLPVLRTEGGGCVPRVGTKGWT